MTVRMTLVINTVLFLRKVKICAMSQRIWHQLSYKLTSHFNQPWLFKVPNPYLNYSGQLSPISIEVEKRMA